MRRNASAVHHSVWCICQAPEVRGHRGDESGELSHAGVLKPKMDLGSIHSIIAYLMELLQPDALGVSYWQDWHNLELESGLCQDRSKSLPILLYQ